MHIDIKTVPNQKIIRINKEPCGKGNLFSQINIESLENAAQNLDAGAFKLWVYFAKNQNNYSFALSSKSVAETFGIGKTQYDNAIKKLISAGYLVLSKGNVYNFYEKAVVLNQDNTITENDVVLNQDNTDIMKEDNTVVLNYNNTLIENNERNIINNTIHNTIDNTNQLSPALQKKINHAREIYKTCTGKNKEFIF